MEVIPRPRSADENRDTLMLFGGTALILLGAGLILSNSSVRKHLGGGQVLNLLRSIAPDIQRYLKMKAM